VWIGADEVIWTPSLIQCGYEWTSANIRINMNQYLCMQNTGKFTVLVSVIQIYASLVTIQRKVNLNKGNLGDASTEITDIVMDICYIGIS